MIQKRKSVRDSDGIALTFRARPYLWSLVLVGIAATVLGGALHYNQAFVHESSFQNERAFRVLDELVAEIQNLESSRATVLTSVPMPIVRDMLQCSGSRSAESVKLDSESPWIYREERFNNYITRLDFSRGKLCWMPTASAAPGATRMPPAEAFADAQSVASKSCKEQGTEDVRLILSIRNDQLTSVLCGQDRRIVLQEALGRAMARFVSQDFFDDALLTLADGTVIGEFPTHDRDTRDVVIRLHASMADRIDIITVGPLLESASTASSSGELPAQLRTASSSQTPARSGGKQPFAATTTLREQTFRAWVLPFNARFRLALADHPGSDNYLYVIGLRRVDFSRDVMHALWPVGLWAIVLLVSLNLVAWPLLSLALGSPEESISRAKAIGCAAGVILVPAILITAAASVWSDFELDSRMRDQAWHYADEVVARLRNDLLDGAQMLNSFRPVYRPFLEAGGSSAPTCENVLQLPDLTSRLLHQCANEGLLRGPWLSYRNQGQPRLVCAGTTSAEGATSCRTTRLIDPSAAKDPLGRWSPFRSIIALNQDGQRFGPAFTSFSTIPVKETLDLADREYFQALKLNQAWPLQPDDGEPVPVIAQRLFNRADASKALQIAVPLCDPTQNGRDSRFCGLITGDLAVHSLIASVTPPLLQFAVIDATTGTVIFSSRDAHSLAESFFLESERDRALYAAIRSRHPQEFRASYMGDPHRFVYEPIKNVPWGVLVFYSEKELADLPFRAGVAAMTSYAGLLVTVAVLLGLAVWIVSLFVERLWSNIHPEKRPPLWYDQIGGDFGGYVTRLRPFVWVILALLISSLCGLEPLQAVITAYTILVIAVLSGLPFNTKKHRNPPRGTDPPAHDSEGLRSQAQRFSHCILIVVCIVSIIPAYGLFLAFHHLQLDALVRDGLVENATQLQARYDVLQQDLRRWMPPDGKEWRDNILISPDLWSLTLHPNTGMAHAEDDLPADVTVEETDLPAVREELTWRTPALYKRLIWQSITESSEQERRQALLSISALEQSNPAAAEPGFDMTCGTSRATRQDMCAVRMSDGKWLAFRAKSIAGRLLDQDFEWMWVRAASLVAVFLGVAVGIWSLARLFTGRLLGVGAPYQAQAIGEPPTLTAFKSQWSALSRAEHLVLYQIASEQIVNPRNTKPVKDLLAQNFIRLNPWPVLANDDFKEYILQAHTPAEYGQWQHEAAKGLWRTVRIPLFIFLMIVIAWLSWAAGGSMKAISAILAATVAFIGQLAQLLNFARGNASSSSSGR